MKNNGPVYNLTTGKINFPIDDRVAIDPEGHISYRVGDHTAISPMPPSNNTWDYNNQPNYQPVRNYSRTPRRNTGPFILDRSNLGIACHGGVDHGNQIWQILLKPSLFLFCQ